MKSFKKFSLRRKIIFKNMFNKIKKNKNIKKAFVVFSLIAFALALFPGSAYTSSPEFNTHQNDKKTLRVGNSTKNITWSNSVPASPGDRVAFNVYYHNNVEGTTARNTKIRIDFPCSERTTITPTAYISASNAGTISDMATINVSGRAQKLDFDSTAKWYPDQKTTSTDISVRQVGSCSVEVDIGDIKGCWDWQGYVVFTASLVDDKKDPWGDLDCYSETEDSIRLSYEFEEGSNVSLFRGNTRLRIIGSGDRSGTYRDTGLSPNTSYTYYLRDGTSTSSPQLARVTCRTAREDKDPWGDLDCYSETEDSIRLSYDFEEGSNVSLFRGNTRLRIIGSGDRSGTYRDTGLSPNTSYTYYLRDGTRTSSQRLARVVCRTEREDEEGEIRVEKQVKSIDRNTSFRDSLSASPGERITYSIKVSALGDRLRDVVVRDTLPSHIEFDGNLRLDGRLVIGSLDRGIDIGDISRGSSKEITFNARVAPVDRFLIGTTSVTNLASAQSREDDDRDTATVHVTRAGAPPTEAPTGVTGNGLVDYILLPLLFVIALLLIFKKQVALFLQEVSKMSREVRQEW